MSVIAYECDKCGEEIKGEVCGDYGGGDYCNSCWFPIQRRYLKRQIEEKEEWLEGTHLKDLRKLRAELVDIERQIAEMGDAE